jgi:cysteine desulfurase/selenocysteine lyase
MPLLLDRAAIHRDFPCLNRPIGGRLPVYLDNSCMTLKPQVVLDAMLHYYHHNPSCHHRAHHKFGEATTRQFDEARRSIQQEIGAKDPAEVIFTRNTTEAINLVAHGLDLKAGDIVLTSDLEHNSNLLPWQARAEQGVRHLTFSIRPDAGFDSWEEYERLLTEHQITLVSVFHTSHVLGITLPIAQMSALAHRHGALFLLDAAQGLPHHRLDVQRLGVDFMAVSFHKAFGPTGLGALYGRRELLLKWQPLIRGGETVDDVTLDSHRLADLPFRLEAGLQDYAGALGAARGLQYLEDLGFEGLQDHERDLNRQLTDELRSLRGVRILGPQSPDQRGSIVNLVFDSIDAREVAVILDETENIMTRGGVHCCHAWYHRYDVPASLRVSLSVYNTADEIQLLARTLAKVLRFF